MGFACCNTYQLDLGVSCTAMRNGALFKKGDAGSPALVSFLLPFPSFQQLCSDCLLALKRLSEIIFLSIFLVILRRCAVKPATLYFLLPVSSCFWIKCCPLYCLELKDLVPFMALPCMTCMNTYAHCMEHATRFLVT